MMEHDKDMAEVEGLLAEARQDSARLDWLERGGALDFCTKPNSAGWLSWSHLDEPNLRAAIDAARGGAV